ncbi:hypothetical protein BBJ28_00010209 [Nothophytophthora sp. Chile5]|nr:hypothetical protein BBJ28_00010209 [Nothophytophthora sp. Chile5]
MDCYWTRAARTHFSRERTQELSLPNQEAASTSRLPDWKPSRRLPLFLPALWLSFSTSFSISPSDRQAQPAQATMSPATSCPQLQRLGFLLLTLLLCLLSPATAQSGADVATQIDEIGGSALSGGQATAALAASVHNTLVNFGDIGGSALTVLSQIQEAANANAIANARLNAALQALLDEAQTFTGVDGTVGSAFGDLRSLRSRPEN